tara:strand:+ start:5391 stop:5879 length:489 start_codon:yes stop_codon:yes gene_type:complete
MTARAETVRAEHEDRGATPETASKLRYDVVLRLYERRRITPEQYAAAEEIQIVWAALCRGLYPSGRGFDGRVDESGGTFLDPLDRMTVAEERMLRLRYRPWMDDVGRIRVGGVTLLDIVLMLCVDNYSLRVIETMLGLRHGCVLGYVRNALGLYAMIARKSI